MVYPGSSLPSEELFSCSSPLLPCQEQIWFLHHINGAGAAYNRIHAFRLSGFLNRGALQRALDEVVARHEALRTNIRDVDGSPRQVVVPPYHVELRDQQVKAEFGRSLEEEVAEWFLMEARRPIDIVRDPMFQAYLLHLAGEENILVLKRHHIISDGWSTRILIRELSLLYSAYVDGMDTRLPALSIRYRDLACILAERSQSAELMRKLDDWKSRLEGSPKLLSVRADRPRPVRQSFRGAHEPVRLPMDLCGGLGTLARQCGVTMYTMMLTAFSVLLHRYTGMDDIVVGSPFSIRSEETERVIGFLMDTVVLRLDLTEDPTFVELLDRVSSIVAHARQNVVPFGKLVQAIQPERDTAYSPLFQVMFQFEETPSEPLSLAGLTVRRMELEKGTSKFDLRLSLEGWTSEIYGSLEYDTALYHAATIRRLLGHWRNLLEHIVINPSVRISTLPLLSDEERRQSLVAWNDTDAEYPQLTVPQLFKVQAKRHPEKVAVVFGQQRLTYRQLDEESTGLALQLAALGVAPDGLVAICMERSTQMLVALLAILKAGGAYLPLDPAYPERSLKFMLEDSGAALLVTESALLSRLPVTSMKVVCIDVGVEYSAKQPTDSASFAEPGLENLAYVIYTSGSTGLPKGVEIHHRALTNFLVSMQRRPGLTEKDSLLAVTTLSFDIAGLELWLPLITGATVILVGRDVSADGTRLNKAVADSGATVMQATPATWRLLLESGWLGNPRLKVLCGGEALVPELAQALLARAASVWNLYGPTETTVWSTVWQVQQNRYPISVGRPIANTQVYILDAHMHPVPVGVPGELYIGGDGVARKYRFRPELTAMRFVPDLFRPGPSRHLYRTGDLGCYQHDGTIQVLGRIDRQLKIRGFRIEPGQVESALLEHTAVARAVATARGTTADQQYLVAYLTTRPGTKVLASELRAWTLDKLPPYMVPSFFVVLDDLPMTPNGKVDYKALPDPGQIPAESRTAYTAPRDDTERKLVRMWQKILSRRRVGIRDNFFELGGHSLLAARLFVRIEKDFGQSLSVTTLFHSPTVESLARELRGEGLAPTKSLLVPIVSSVSRPPLFLVHAVGGSVLNYRDLANGIGNAWPVYGIQPRGLQAGEIPHTRIEDMAADYISELRKVQENGPYYLGGASFGGVVAFEMAKQLTADGQPVAFLALIDSTPQEMFLGRSNLATVQVWSFLARRLLFHGENLLTLAWPQKIDYARQRWKTFKARCSTHFWSRRVSRVQGDREQVPDRLRIVKEANRHAARTYTVSAQQLHAVSFRAIEIHPLLARDRLNGWGPWLLGGVEDCPIPGNHATMLSRPNVDHLANELKVRLEQAYRRAEQSNQQSLSFRHMVTPPITASRVESAYGAEQDSFVAQPSGITTSF